MIPQNNTPRRMEKLRHERSRMDEEHCIDRKERQKKNRVLDRQTCLQIDNTSHKLDDAKEDKRRRDEQRERNKARERSKAKNHSDVSGLIAQHILGAMKTYFCWFVMFIYSCLYRVIKERWSMTRTSSHVETSWRK